MIQAKDLRIGNWVNRTEGFKIFKSKVSAHTISCAASDGSIDFLSPIPLTPEILEKCGFVKEDRLNVGANTYFKKGMGEYLTYQFDGFCVYELNKAIVKYLHQLQNLFFALCGEELEVNL